MKSYLKLTAAVIAILALIFTGANLFLHNENKGGAGRPYRVEAERIAAKIERGEEYSLEDCLYIQDVVLQENGFQGGDSDYLVRYRGGSVFQHLLRCYGGVCAAFAPVPASQNHPPV